MARILLAVWPIPGHYYPNLALARALMAKGHSVAVCTGGRAQPVVEAAGATCLPFTATDERPLEHLFFAPNQARARWRPALLSARDAYFEWIAGTLDGQVADVRAAIDLWHPDVVVCDPTLWGPFLVLPELTAVPFAIFAYIPFCPIPGPAVPPLGPGLPLARSPLERLRHDLYRRAFRAGTARFRERANALRERHGLAPLRVSPTEHAGTLPLYLVAGTSEFDYGRRDLPESVRYVGPCLWTRERDTPARWLSEVRGDQPWIHVTEGTVNTRGPVLSRAAALGLSGLPLQTIVSTSARGADADLGVGPLPSNVRLEHWTDIHLQDLLPRTRVVVTSGGGGIVISALAHGVPLVIAPTDWDKPEIAQRVVESGAGIRLSARQRTPEGVRSAVERILADGSYAHNARRLADSFGRQGVPAEAARLIERLASPATSIKGESAPAFCMAGDVVQ